MLRPLIDALRQHVEAVQQSRADSECKQRQAEKAHAVRQAKADEHSEEFYLRQRLMQEADRWHQAENIRIYLNDIQRRVDSGDLVPGDPERFRWCAQIFNFYLAAFKQFCRWMVRDGRASESPVAHLTGLNVKTDRRHDRRALTVEELRWLMETTRDGPERFGMTGPEQAMLYRVAVETGLRRGAPTAGTPIVMTVVQTVTRRSLDGADVMAGAARATRRLVAGSAARRARRPRAARKSAPSAWRSSWRSADAFHGFRRAPADRKRLRSDLQKTLANRRKTAENQGRKQHLVGCPSG